MSQNQETVKGTYTPTREQREQLKTLSMEIFGSSGKWRKLLEKGTEELITYKTQEVIPGENGSEPTLKEVELPVLSNGVKQYRQKYYTVESLLETLLNVKSKRDALLLMVQKQKEEEKAKKEAEELQKKLQDDLGGSAL